MTTLFDEIEAEIATLFNCFIQCDFHHSHDSNNYSMGFEGNSFQYIYLIRKLYCSEQL